MILLIKKIYYKQNFFPDIFGLIINPYYFARAGLAKSISSFSRHLNGDILDVGCGSKPYEKLFNFDRYIGLDIDSEISRKLGIADYYYDGKTFPFSPNSFDCVLCNQVLEHVFEPDAFLQEIHTVLKSNGKLLLTVPFVWDEHEQPYDYARYSSFGIKSLLIKNGFDVIENKKIGDDASVIFQLINAYIIKVIARFPRIIRIVLRIILTGSVNIIGFILCKILPNNPDLFLDQIVLARKR